MPLRFVPKAVQSTRSRHRKPSFITSCLVPNPSKDPEISSCLYVLSQKTVPKHNIKFPALPLRGSSCQATAWRAKISSNKSGNSNRRFSRQTLNVKRLVWRHFLADRRGGPLQEARNKGQHVKTRIAVPSPSKDPEISSCLYVLSQKRHKAQDQVSSLAT